MQKALIENEVDKVAREIMLETIEEINKELKTKHNENTSLS